MISRITIKNFKSIGDKPGIDLDLKPLTLLVGPNGGGKSSILEAIDFIAENGKLGPLGVPQHLELLHKREESRQAEIQLRLTVPDGANVRYIVKRGGVSEREYKVNGQAIPDTQVSWIHTQIRFISSVRGAVPFVQDTGSYPEWVGKRGEHLLPLLARIYGQRENEDIASKVSVWAARFGIEGLKAGIMGSNSLGSDYHEKPSGVFLNFALAASGAKQIMAVVAQLFWSQRGSVTLTEEPEISLHPKAQTDVTELFAEAMEEGKQIIATTHSTFLVLGLGATVQKGLLKAEDIAIYHVEKKPEVGTVATRLPVNEEGYVEGWIPSFAKEERKLLREWWKTVPAETEPQEQ